MKRSVDARRLPCPKPVILTRQAINEGGFTSLEILVDNIAAKENVLRMLSACGYEDASADQTDYGYLVTVGEKTTEVTDVPPVPLEKCLFFSSKHLGSGEEALGTLLMRGFIYSLTELECPPTTLIFMNSAVYLALKDADTVKDLMRLEDAGVNILVCGTCLDYYRVTDELAVGEISNMYSITEALLTGETVKIS